MNRKHTEEFLLKNIFHLSNRLQAVGDKISSELTLKQWLLLSSLYKGMKANPSINDIAVYMGITRQSAKKLVYNLEKEGYIEVDQSPDDKRALRVGPTEKSHHFFRNHNHLLSGFADEIFADIDDEELSAAYDVLLKVRDNIARSNEQKT